MEECAEQLREVQKKLEKLPSKDEDWNKDMRDEIDGFCAILTI